ncbi:nucleolar complex protein 2 homolog [Trichogramma pretiosum]|uniref:nucleolar complex protein 2 homolog n=1 Tax=Trichogramma pretiosum TaxID=7493 RepID=UPI0006C9CD2D|nr:nucleolar complex protein 2 homolog [Trichogramma pretiosum]
METKMETEVEKNMLSTYIEKRIEESLFIKMLENSETTDVSVYVQENLSKVTMKKWKTVLEQYTRDAQKTERKCSLSKIIKCVLESFQYNKINNFQKFFDKYMDLFGELLPQALQQYLQVNDDVKPHKSESFKTIEKSLKIYFISLLKAAAKEDKLQSLDFFSHLLEMLPFVESFSELHEPILCIVLAHWDVDSEFEILLEVEKCLIAILSNQKFNVDVESLFEGMLVKYTKCKEFATQLSTDEDIESYFAVMKNMKNFMVQYFLLQTDITYKIAFTHLLHMGKMIDEAHLQPAKHYQDIYNWAYISKLEIFSEVASKAQEPSTLRQLIDPVSQMIEKVIRLMPSVKFYPLRFHCIKMLINICKNAQVYFRIYPFLTEVLEKFDFNRTVKSPRWEPMSPWILLTRLQSPSRHEDVEDAFRDAVVNVIYELILEFAQSQSHCCYFPDAAIHVLHKLQIFLDRCETPLYTEKMKQLRDKIIENCQFIVENRSNVTLSLTDMHKILSWESHIKNSGTTLNAFANQRIKKGKNYLPL